MMLRRSLFAVLLSGALIATAAMSPHAAAGPLGSVDSGSGGGSLSGPPGGGPITDRSFTLRFELPGDRPGTYSVRGTVTDSACASHETSLYLDWTLPPGHSGGSMQGVLAFLRDANPFNACAFAPSIVVWNVTLTTPLGVQVYRVACLTRSGDTWQTFDPSDETAVAEPIQVVPGGLLFKVK